MSSWDKANDEGSDVLPDDHKSEEHPLLPVHGRCGSCVSFKTIAIIALTIMACVITGLVVNMLSQDQDAASQGTVDSLKQEMELYLTNVENRLSGTFKTDLTILNNTLDQSLEQVYSDIQSLNSQMELGMSDVEKKLNSTMENDQNMHDELLLLNETSEQSKQQVNADIASLENKIAIAQAEINRIEELLNVTTTPTRVVTTTPTSVVTQTTPLPVPPTIPGGAYNHSRGTICPTSIMYLFMNILVYLVSNTNVL